MQRRWPRKANAPFVSKKIVNPCWFSVARKNEQFAAPLNMVERIEKIKATDIETVGGKRVIRYRGGSLPLFSVDEVSMVEPLADSEDLLVIVFILNNREIGLLAIGPVDAV